MPSSKDCGPKLGVGLGVGSRSRRRSRRWSRVGVGVGVGVRVGGGRGGEGQPFKPNVDIIDTNKTSVHPSHRCQPGRRREMCAITAPMAHDAAELLSGAPKARVLHSKYAGCAQLNAVVCFKNKTCPFKKKNTQSRSRERRRGVPAGKRYNRRVLL